MHENIFPTPLEVVSMIQDTPGNIYDKLEEFLALHPVPQIIISALNRIL
jgi:hypothetical protein